MTEQKAVEAVVRRVNNIGKVKCSFLCEKDLNPESVFLTNVQLNHSGHSAKIELGLSSYMPRRDKMLDALKLFMLYGPKGRGFQKSAQRYMKELFPDVKIPLDTLRNAIGALRPNEKECFELISFLSEGSTN